jgi:hypothetical protein
VPDAGHACSLSLLLLGGIIWSARFDVTIGFLIVIRQSSIVALDLLATLAAAENSHVDAPLFGRKNGGYGWRFRRAAGAGLSLPAST